MTDPTWNVFYPKPTAMPEAIAKALLEADSRRDEFRRMIAGIPYERKGNYGLLRLFAAFAGITARFGK